jgi:hypothetical protein
MKRMLSAEFKADYQAIKFEPEWQRQHFESGEIISGR